MASNKVIIFGNSHHNTLGLVRSLGEKGVRPILLLEPCDLRFCCIRFSKYIAKIHYLDKLEDGLKVLCEAYGEEAEKPIVLNAGDQSMCLLDAHYDELKEHFCIFNANGEQGRINFFMDKSNQFPVAGKCGLNLIKTWRIKDSTNLPTDIAYPCLIKGNNSTSSGKEMMFVCKDREELLAHLPNDGDCLVQEYIEKDFELDITGLSVNHGETVLIPAVVRKIRESLTRQSDYIRLDDVAEYPTLEVDKIKAFVRAIGYEGIFSVEMLCRQGKFYFLEINLRNDGVGYLYTAAGINYPHLWVRYNCGEQIDEADEAAKLQAPRSLMTLWDVDNLLKGRVKFAQWLQEWLGVKTHFVLNRKDMQPFLYLAMLLMGALVKKIIRKIKRTVA